MKKYILSASLGIAIGTIISIITSAVFGQGTYLPLNPFSTMGAYYLSNFNQVTVMLICVVIWAAIGLLFQLADTIFEQDWSLLRMTATHFGITVLGFTPLGILAGWFPVKLGALLFFWLIFVLVYALLFFLNYRKMERQIKDINGRL
ncbi:TPA: DUF3021 domain-containing protein [Streptococcus suis]|uniref:DUF3021 domain-containing protein n=1 Tax=Streptococcus suis TaxID=1307 RepID=A0A0Z8H524_STRSU|nr:DUF3021 domain-containing protein [Streptococcus suis]MCQ8272800.1 DUF3021 domain-containing protein [Streptococcus suis]MCQ8786513.1 DUF3021 domain-containing protein [Streptococcus suis]MDW8721495.1 DUF3021 domain-containing protein [Streptococcus suis]MDY7600955.1 DUF3021 domain-containing protein [Streptococcus suis]MEE3747395.1 DUF3021 domain-containing protein [Streptococcus suis]